MNIVYMHLLEIAADQGKEPPVSNKYFQELLGLSSGRISQIADPSSVAKLGAESLSCLANLGYNPKWVNGESKKKYISFTTSSKTQTTVDTSDIDALRADGRDVYQIGMGRPVPVIGQGNGGHLPERVWDDQGYPVGAFDEFAEIATSDQHAFIVRVRGDSMYPKYTPGEYALVEPDASPDVGDDVLVRLATGETLIKTLAARSSDGVRLSSYNSSEVKFYSHAEVSWMYWVPFPVPSKKIKMRVL